MAKKADSYLRVLNDPYFLSSITNEIYTQTGELVTGLWWHYDPANKLFVLEGAWGKGLGVHSTITEEALMGWSKEEIGMWLSGEGRDLARDISKAMKDHMKSMKPVPKPFEWEREGELYADHDPVAGF